MGKNAGKNDFWANEQESRKYRSLMASFYDFLVPGCKLHYMDGDSYFEQYVQKKLDIDLLLEEPRSVLDSYEEKLAAWPGSGEPHSHICFETESNSNPGLVTKGWGFTCQANYLVYAFEILPLNLLDIFLINLPALKDYLLPEYKKNPRRFPSFRNEDRNRSQGILVGIGEIYRCVAGTKRYHLHFNGTCKEVHISVSLSQMLMEVPS